MKTKIVSCHTVDSKPVKQELNGTVILPPLVFPGWDVRDCMRSTNGNLDRHSTRKKVFGIVRRSIHWCTATLTPASSTHQSTETWYGQNMRHHWCTPTTDVLKHANWQREERTHNHTKWRRRNKEKKVWCEWKRVRTNWSSGWGLFWLCWPKCFAAAAQQKNKKKFFWWKKTRKFGRKKLKLVDNEDDNDKNAWSKKSV